MRCLGIAVLVLAACARHAGGNAAPAGPAVLEGTSWRLDERRWGTDETLTFPERGRVAGKAACNRYFGNVEISGESIRIAGIGSTKMACAGDAMEQERLFLEALERVTRYAIEGDTLTIWVDGFDKPMRFARQ